MRRQLLLFFHFELFKLLLSVILTLELDAILNLVVRQQFYCSFSGNARGSLVV